MLKYNQTLTDEGNADEMILDQYRSFLISYPDKVYIYTRQITNSGGNRITPILMMARVNTLMQSWVEHG